MTEETAPDYRALLDALGYPPIAGGAEDAPAQQDTPEQTSGASGPPAEETPATEPQDGSTSDDNWQERYSEAQAWGTRAAQEAAQYRQIIDLARQGDPEALEYLGYEAPAEEEPKDDGYSTDDDRIAALEQQLAQQQEQAEFEQQQAQLEEAANRFYDVEFGRLDPESKWSDQYRQLVAAVGDEFLDDDGLPQLEKAHEALQAEFEDSFKARVNSKRTPQAPSGASPSHNPDLDDKEQRREWLAQQLAASDSPIE